MTCGCHEKRIRLKTVNIDTNYCTLHGPLCNVLVLQSVLEELKISLDSPWSGGSLHVSSTAHAQLSTAHERTV